MDELTGAQVLERVGQKIRTLCEQIEKEPASCAEALSGELERCLQLWSECRVNGERRYVWSDGRDLPRAGECDALTLPTGEACWLALSKAVKPHEF